jgi:hypothetical protein
VSYLVAEIDVIGAGVIIIDGQFDETQAQNLRVEVEGLLRVARYCGDVVKTEDTLGHGSILIVPSSITSLRGESIQIGKGTKYSSFQPERVCA